METDLEVPSPGPSPKVPAARSSMPQEWTAERLKLKSAATAGRQIRRFHQVPDRELPGEVRA